MMENISASTIMLWQMHKPHNISWDRHTSTKPHRDTPAILCGIHIQTLSTWSNQYKIYTWIRCTELHLQVFATSEWFILFPSPCCSHLVMQLFNTNQASLGVFLGFHCFRCSFFFPLCVVQWYVEEIVYINQQTLCRNHAGFSLMILYIYRDVACVYSIYSEYS